MMSDFGWASTEYYTEPDMQFICTYFAIQQKIIYWNTRWMALTLFCHNNLTITIMVIVKRNAV